MNRPSAKRQLRLLAALLPPLAAALLQWLAWPLTAPFLWLLFSPAIFLSAWIGGFAGGAAATAASIALVQIVFIQPYFPASEQSSVLAGAIILAASGVLFSAFHGRLHRGEQRLRQSSRRLQLLLESVPEGIVAVDAEGTCTFINPAGLKLLGYHRPDQLVGRPLPPVIAASDADAGSPDADPVVQALRQGREQQFDKVLLRRADGGTFPASCRIQPLRHDSRFDCAFIIFSDISAHLEDDERLRQAAIVFDNTDQAIVVTDPHGDIVRVNSAYTRITGYRPDEVLGKNPRLHQSGRHDKAFYARMWGSLTRTGQWQGEIWNRRKNGEIYPAWENISVVRDESGRRTHYVALLSDISSIKQSEERLRRQAHHDVLTGLPNRLLFTASLEHALERAKRHQRRLALLFLDLDRFKHINDSFGHAAGDRLLQIVAERLSRSVRAEDLVARLGGDEFTVILEQIGDADAAALLTRKLIEVVAQPVDIEGNEIRTSTSIGIGLYPDDATNADDLIKAADTAMYQAKAQGRHTFAFYTAELTAGSLRHRTVEHELRRALAEGELELYYQPQIELASDRLVGLEALLRWRHPQEGLLLPERFIPIAEESDLIASLGEWVMRAVCAQAAGWAQQGLQPPRISVNLSTRQVLHDHVVETAEAVLARCQQLESLRMEVEISESVLQSTDRGIAVLGRLHELGFGIAIDDFGTGVSSLSLLKRLPVDTLKIDRAFTQELPADATSRAIAAAVVSVAHSLGLRVVAEGVETRDQLDFLRLQGCDEVQGYLCGRPLPAAQVVQWLEPRQATRSMH